MGRTECLQSDSVLRATWNSGDDDSRLPVDHPGHERLLSPSDVQQLLDLQVRWSPKGLLDPSYSLVPLPRSPIAVVLVDRDAVGIHSVLDDGKAVLGEGFGCLAVGGRRREVSEAGERGLVGVDERGQGVGVDDEACEVGRLLEQADGGGSHRVEESKGMGDIEDEEIEMVRVLGAEEPVSIGQPAQMHIDAGRQAHRLGPLRLVLCPSYLPRPILSSAQPCSPEFPYVHPYRIASCCRLLPSTAEIDALDRLPFCSGRPLRNPSPEISPPPAPLVQARVAAAPSSFRTLSTSVVRKGSSIQTSWILRGGSKEEG